jgi:predicted AlkP superfamily pyrophosphatase or phosphodiesterase
MSGVMSVVLFLVDGMRPDGLKQADTPTFDRLLASGAHTFSARTVMPSSTLPCHTSLFHSVLPERHGITTNTWTPQVRPIPGLIDVIHRAGGMTAAFYNWEELRDISRPNSLNASFFLKNGYDPAGAGDREITELALSWLSQNPFTFAFVYLGYTDIAGHAHGWMSRQYLQGIANADQCIGRVISALPLECTTIVMSDHGGHEYTHGTELAEDMTIPWLINGPGIPAGRQLERPVNIIDVAPTVTQLLGMTSPPEWQGTAVSFDTGG